MVRLSLLGALLLSTLFAGMVTQAATASVAPLDTHEYLIQFHRDPAQILNARLHRRDENGKILRNTTSAFSAADIKSKKALIYRDEVRRQICRRAGIDCRSTRGKQRVFAEVGEREMIEKFLENIVILRRLSEIDVAKLTQRTLQKSPWSDSFWPVHKGLIARRFADGEFPDSSDWATNYAYIQSRPPATISPDIMAPAEKYDYLIGDTAWRLSDRMWGEGRGYVAQYGYVPSWVGLCHGWAPASFMYDRPLRAVTVPTYYGGSVTFYASDIKALAAELWGEAKETVKFVGRRCTNHNPPEDELGRSTNDACFDVNPGTWHMAVVNQVGSLQRSLVLDSSFDYEVWNYPIYAYQYHYFNPQTLAVSNSLAGSAVPVSEFTIDKFKKYRGAKVKSVVGIAMDVTYSIPTQPSRRPILKDKNHTVRYVYDLELDASGNIIGGEWYSNFHPDFLWYPPFGTRAVSGVERGRDQPLIWDGKTAVSDDVRTAGAKASARGQPLAVIVDRLVELASQPESGSP